MVKIGRKSFISSTFIILIFLIIIISSAASKKHHKRARVLNDTLVIDRDGEIKRNSTNYQNLTQVESKKAEKLPTVKKSEIEVSDSQNLDRNGGDEQSLKNLKIEKRSIIEELYDVDEGQVEEEPLPPMLISKKAAKSLNKIANVIRGSYDYKPRSSSYRQREMMTRSGASNDKMRRNPKERKNYLRCYFNAVSCF